MWSYKNSLTGSGTAVLFGSKDFCHLSSSELVDCDFFIAVLFPYMLVQLTDINAVYMNTAEYLCSMFM